MDSILAAIEKLEERNSQKKEAWVKEAAEVRTQSMENFRDSERGLRILRKYATNPPTNVAEVADLVSVTCWGNTGFCCPIGRKVCSWRNLVLAILEIDPREYTRKKEELGNSLEKRILSDKKEPLKQNKT